MSNIKELYRKNIYGVMGTLIFHILLIAGFWVADLKINVKIKKEETILLDFILPEVKKESPVSLNEKQQVNNAASNHSVKNIQESGSNRAVNEALRKDKFFDDNYKRDIEDAKKMVADVNNQLSKKVTTIKKFDMPEVTTEGLEPDSIKNVIYSGKSNIHYFLENRFHVRLPIPVYLAKNGGEIKVDIQVDQSGKVIKAEARPSKSNYDPNLIEYAIQAAERTVFNADTKAQTIQKGSITYKFVAQ
jgi:TonB family protein